MKRSLGKGVFYAGGKGNQRADESFDKSKGSNTALNNFKDGLDTGKSTK